MERLGYGDVMASYKDYLNGKIHVTIENISKAVSSMASAANKRLKRQEEQGWKYAGDVSERSEGTNTIAGYEKFGAKGKSKQQLFSEFKRLKRFFESGFSSVTEVRQQARKFKVRESELYEYVQMQEAKNQYEKDVEQKIEYKTKPRTKREEKDLKQALKAEKARKKRSGEEFNEDDNYSMEWYRDWLDGLSLYNYLIDKRMYIPSSRDSDQMRYICETIIANRNMYEGYDTEELAQMAVDMYNSENSKWGQGRYRGKSVSDFIYGNN